MSERTASFPPAFLDMMRRQLGPAFPDFLQAMGEGGQRSRALRINPLRAGAEAASAPYCESPVPWAQYGRYIRPDTRPGASLAHFSGAFYMQEASAMSPAAVLDAQPGERVLDLCAAPGGKASQIAAALRGKGTLVANEPEPERSRMLAGNLERLGVVNAVVTCVLPDRLRAALPDWFDAVLVDAPCSGEGMFARDPAARAEWTEASPAGCAKRQAEILDAAAGLVRPGGRLVYSTCTFNELENEGSVRGFLQRHPDFFAEDFALPGLGRSTDGMLRVYPHLVRGDGHFVARLRRKAGERAAAPVPPRSDPEAPALVRRLLEEAVRALPLDAEGCRFSLRGDRLFALPGEFPEPRGVKLVQPGLCLLRAGRSHIEPAHSLAMALPPELARRQAELGPEEAASWCVGNELTSAGEKGWVWVTCAGLPLGWGKRSGDALKNHLPKGLRRRQ